MSWTYTNNPENVTRDEVRLLIGDTDEDDQQLSDEEIAYYIAEESTSYSAAASAAKGIAATYARLSDKTVDDLSLSYSQRQRHYFTLAAELLAKSSTVGVRAYAGGISISDKQTQEQDTDRVVPDFQKGQFKNPRSGRDNVVVNTKSNQ